MDNLIECAEADIRNIGNLPDHHTVANKDKVKALKKDCEEYEKRIEGVSALHKQFFEKSAGYREEAVRAMEIVEEFRAFKVKTPEEIKADAKLATEKIAAVAERTGEKVDAPAATPVVAGEAK